MNQIMARLAGSAGFCLSVHSTGQQRRPPWDQRSNAASGECETAPACCGACIWRNELPASPTPPQTHSPQIFLLGLMLLQF